MCFGALLRRGKVSVLAAPDSGKSCSWEAMAIRLAREKDPMELLSSLICHPSKTPYIKELMF